MWVTLRPKVWLRLAKLVPASLLSWGSAVGSAACLFFVTLVAASYFNEASPEHTRIKPYILSLLSIPLFLGIALAAFSLRFHRRAKEEPVSPNITRIWGTFSLILTLFIVASDVVTKGWLEMRYAWAKLPIGLCIAWSLFNNAKRREQANEQQIAYQQMLDRQNGPPC